MLIFFSGALTLFLLPPKNQERNLHCWVNLERSPLNRIPAHYFLCCGLCLLVFSALWPQSHALPYNKQVCPPIRLAKAKFPTTLAEAALQEHINTKFKHVVNFCYNVNGSLNCWCVSCILFTQIICIDRSYRIFLIVMWCIYWQTYTTTNHQLYLSNRCIQWSGWLLSRENTMWVVCWGEGYVGWRDEQTVEEARLPRSWNCHETGY